MDGSNGKIVGLLERIAAGQDQIVERLERIEEGQGEVVQRLDKLEQGQERIVGRLDNMLGFLGHHQADHEHRLRALEERVFKKTD